MPMTLLAKSPFMQRFFAQKITGLSPQDASITAFFTGGADNISGVTVNDNTITTLSAVWAAVRIISENLASLPLITYRRIGANAKERARDHHVYGLLHDRPNKLQTSFVWREASEAQVLVTGNTYSEIIRDGVGRPVEVILLNPKTTTPMLREDGALFYQVQRRNMGQDILPAEDVLHVPGLSFDGLKGISVVTKARLSVGLALAAERCGAGLFGRGLMPSGILQHPSRLSDKALQNLTEQKEREHAGVDRQHRLLITEEGMKYTPLSFTPEDSQFLQTRVFQVEEVARWFTISASKLKATGSGERRANVEQYALEFVVDTLRPWLVRWEQELNYKLFSKSEREIYYVEFLVDALLRGDVKTRMNGYNIALQTGLFTRDEIRAKENMNPLPDGVGAMPLFPLNMAPADQVVNPPDNGEGAMAFVPILRELLGRLWRKEVKAFDISTAKGGEWLERFAEDHKGYVRSGITPFVDSIAGFLGANNGVTKTVVDMWCERYNQRAASLHPPDASAEAAWIIAALKETNHGNETES